MNLGKQTICMACSGHSGSVVSTRLMVLPSLSNKKFDHVPPSMLEPDTEVVCATFELSSHIVALSFGIIPLDSALKLTLDMGDHGGWVSIDHVITIKALSMGDPDPPQGYAL